MLEMSVTFLWEVSFLAAGVVAVEEEEEEGLLSCSLSAMVETDELRSNLLESKSLRKLPVTGFAAVVVANSGDS